MTGSSNNIDLVSKTIDGSCFGLNSIIFFLDGKKLRPHLTIMYNYMTDTRFAFKSHREVVKSESAVFLPCLWPDDAVQFSDVESELEYIA